LAVFVAAAEDEDLLIELLGAGFEGSYLNDAGETPLHAAVKADKPKSVSALLGCDSCDPNAVDGHKQTALHRAGEFGYVKCLEFLVSHERVNVDAEDAWSRTALHWTAQKGLLDLTSTLLQRQAKMITTVTKETPLHWAVRGGHRDIVALLLTRHPDLSVYALNDRMESPMEVSRTLGFGSIVQLLWEHGEAHNQVPPTLNTVFNTSQLHESAGIKPMTMKPKGGVRKLTIKHNVDSSSSSSS
jgi:ankyrin repeat protein